MKIKSSIQSIRSTTHDLTSYGGEIVEMNLEPSPHNSRCFIQEFIATPNEKRILGTSSGYAHAFHKKPQLSKRKFSKTIGSRSGLHWARKTGRKCRRGTVHSNYRSSEIQDGQPWAR